MEAIVVNLYHGSGVDYEMIAVGLGSQQSQRVTKNRLSWGTEKYSTEEIQTEIAGDSSFDEHVPHNT